MDLKKEMEKDLEEFEKELALSCSSLYSSKLTGKIDLIKKYLKYFKNDMSIEVGKKFKIKKERRMAAKNKNGWNIVWEKVRVTYLSEYNCITFECGKGLFELDSETFKSIFEEVKPNE